MSVEIQPMFSLIVHPDIRGNLITKLDIQDLCTLIATSKLFSFSEEEITETLKRGTLLNIEVIRRLKSENFQALFNECLKTRAFTHVQISSQESDILSNLLFSTKHFGENIRQLDINGNTSSCNFSNFFNGFPHLEAVKIDAQNHSCAISEIVHCNSLKQFALTSKIGMYGIRFFANPQLEKVDLTKCTLFSPPTDRDCPSLKDLSHSFRHQQQECDAMDF